MPTTIRTSDERWGYPLLVRLHFYAGFFVGPFIFVAALSGALFALTPQVERWLYDSVLTVQQGGEHRPVADQIRVARQAIGHSAILSAVRPAPADGLTTRVMFSVDGLAEGEHQAVFVDPSTLDIRGSLVVYGTSGTLPFRIWIDFLHRELHLGEVGRYYSELAASWLWLVALGGLLLWWRRRRADSGLSGDSPRSRLRYWHSTLGVVLSVALLFFSITGLTWSNWAGANIAALRAQMDWSTPELNTALAPDQPAGEVLHHQGHGAANPEPVQQIDRPELFDQMLAKARATGIDAAILEIKPAADPASAWVVREIDRGWPTQVDAVAIDPRTMTVVGEQVFKDFPIVAKLTRWGIDAHMGVLFGLLNQLFVAFCALALCLLVILGYRMWWLRRPSEVRQTASGPRRVFYHLRKASLKSLLIMALGAILLGVFAPVMGVSLLLFLVIDAWLSRGNISSRAPAL
ncbi:MAG: hypothetical protein CME36_16665 [unclassified Hahellaceae]|mgnify:CR=1 FL=1|nr:hypothetical protein [Hahellaceae bacterium]|tara:strand:- start:219399 stop:220784 length:1386 start_codon:yes stop_codon:yes gene_type:complete